MISAEYGDHYFGAWYEWTESTEMLVGMFESISLKVLMVFRSYHNVSMHGEDK